MRRPDRAEARHRSSPSGRGVRVWICSLLHFLCGCCCCGCCCCEFCRSGAASPTSIDDEETAHEHGGGGECDSDQSEHAAGTRKSVGEPCCAARMRIGRVPCTAACSPAAGSC